MENDQKIDVGEGKELAVAGEESIDSIPSSLSVDDAHPLLPPSPLGSPQDTRLRLSHRQHPSNATNYAIRRVTRVSRHAALTTKQAVWDSNELSIDAALSAVDQWEAGYTHFRHFIVRTCHAASNLYKTSKDGVGKLEHSLLLPVRDWILLPAFGGAERAVRETANFLKSDMCHELADQTLQAARTVPVIGSNVLAPSLCFSVAAVQRTWDVLQYPIPSKEQVRSTVNIALNTTKWVLTGVGREIFLYAVRADANITRTLSHTQWKVLGSGPYATLDASNKQFVIDHFCERYLSGMTPILRYELAAHVKRHNPALYCDLVLTGLLKQRGGEFTQDDEWLNANPLYMTNYLEDEQPFLLYPASVENAKRVSALWFRLPQVNGTRPPRDAPWICFQRREQHILEERYRRIKHDRNVSFPSDNTHSDSHGGGMDHSEQNRASGTKSAPTIASWYTPCDETDLMVDQQRHAVTFFLRCPCCRVQLKTTPPLVAKEYGSVCENCLSKSAAAHLAHDEATLPPVSALVRPTFWRFYGPGDDVRRAIWFLDTTRNGLQPFDEEAQCILEDAYLFLKWMVYRRTNNMTPENKKGDDDPVGLDESLLTVEVTCPDNTARLIQFSSLTRATAIQKGVGAAIALFKRRVYRGAWLATDDVEAREAPLDTSEHSAKAEGTTSEITALRKANATAMSIRSTLELPSPVVAEEQSANTISENAAASFVVPADRLGKPDMARHLKDDKDGKIDHLCLIVHGIGEMLRSVDLFGLSLPDLSSVCSSMRGNHREVQDAHFDRMYPTADEQSRASTGRVEYLPVEWHESFCILTQRREQPLSVASPGKPNVLIKDISLRTIPTMREFANDTLMDILFFMSPRHHDIIIEVVTREMNLVVKKFRETTGFSGTISVIGHSLGSVITWDILSNHGSQGDMEVPLHHVPSVESLGSVFVGSPSSSEQCSNPEVTCSGQESEEDTKYPQLSFTVDNFFLLGSPVPVFLMIRNQRRPLAEEFYLRGCGRTFNIFHPYDPVAYRIEPCIDPRNADFEPTIIKHWNGGFRVQYRTRRLWRKLVESTSRTQRNVVEAFEQSMAGMGLLDATVDAGGDDTESEVSEDRASCVVTGQLNQGRRIDYMLQEKEIENANEYVAALAAHSSYWIEKDLSLFIARQIYLSTLEHAAAEVEAAGLSAWECISDHADD